MRAFVLAVALAFPRIVAADGFGVVVSGDASITAATETAVTAWLTAHAFQISPSPLSTDGVLTLNNCLALTDMNCARGVVEARASVTSLIAIVTQVAGARTHRNVQLSAYWITKAHDVVSVQRTCDACTDALLPQTIEALMTDLARLTPAMRGHIKVVSTPPGVLVTIDDVTVGVTPAEHEVTAGPHDVALSRDGTVLAKRHVDVAPGSTASLTVPVAPVAVAATSPVAHHSRALPVAILVVGLASVGGGLAMYKYGGPTGDNFEYRDLRTPGIGVAVGGGALALLGVILVARGGGESRSTPTVAIASGGVVAGWSRSF